MRIVIPGGTGQLGTVLARGLRARGHEVLIIGRRVEAPGLRWDGRTLGEWCRAIDGADAVVNLAGRSVNCTYNWENLNEMMRSRVETADLVGRAIAQADRPPPVWLQASTASIYAHTTSEAHDEDGTLGGDEPGVPAYWGYSVSIARAWELALEAADTPRTRKVAMRMGFTMSADEGGVFDWLRWLVRIGFGGAFYGGEQYVGWLHEDDLVGAVLFLIESEVEGVVNVTAPNPLPNRDFMAILRASMGARAGLPILPGMAELGAWALGTDVELMRKSRFVTPRRLLDAGHRFHYSAPQAGLRGPPSGALTTESSPDATLHQLGRKRHFESTEGVTVRRFAHPKWAGAAAALCRT